MNTDQAILLISKMLSDHADEQERTIFNAWLTESIENQQLFENAQLIWNQSEHSFAEMKFDKQKGSESILQKLNKPQKQIMRSVQIKWFAAAASILILLAVGYFSLMKDPGLPFIICQAPENSTLEVILPDSSYVTLNQNASLRYSRLFNLYRRKVILDGEAYFSVHPHRKKQFVVQTGNTLTRVLGTSFNLKKYPNGNINLHVSHGKVQFYSLQNRSSRAIFTAGQMGTINDRGKLMERAIISDPNYLSWKTGTLKFDRTPLQDVCKALSRHYSIPVLYSPDNDTISLSATFQDEALPEILRIIELTLDVKYTHTEEGFLLQ